MLNLPNIMRYANNYNYYNLDDAINFLSVDANGGNCELMKKLQIFFYCTSYNRQYVLINKLIEKL